MRRSIRWRDNLDAPMSPGAYRILHSQQGAWVWVTLKDVEEASRHGANPVVELEAVVYGPGRITEYRIAAISEGKK